jgi:4-diphosphocytidyl-2-C-methyl-D-erythritol kinase
MIEDPGLAGTPALLVNPRIALSTAAVFAAWDGADRGPLGDWREGRNDLEAPARHLVREVGAVLDALASASVVRMSGSGATCFGLFESAADRDSMQARIEAAQPNWWTLASRLI